MLDSHYFPFVVRKVLFQTPRRLNLHTQFSIITSRKIVLIFTGFYNRIFLRVVFIPNIIYCIITVWNFRSINNFFVFSLDVIILYFRKDSDFLPTTLLMKVRNFLHSLTDFEYFRFSTIIFLEIYLIPFSGDMCLPTLTSTFIILVAYSLLFETIFSSFH